MHCSKHNTHTHTHTHTHKHTNKYIHTHTHTHSLEAERVASGESGPHRARERHSAVCVPGGCRRCRPSRLQGRPTSPTADQSEKAGQRQALDSAPHVHSLVCAIRWLLPHERGASQVVAQPARPSVVLNCRNCCFCYGASPRRAGVQPYP